MILPWKPEEGEEVTPAESDLLESYLDLWNLTPAGEIRLASENLISLLEALPNQREADLVLLAALKEYLAL